MNDGRRYVPGLKAENGQSIYQGDIFATKNIGNDVNVPKNVPKNGNGKTLTPSQLRKEKWGSKYSNDIFKEGNEADNIADITSCLAEMANEKGSNNINIGEISIYIDPKKPERITFRSTRGLSWAETSCQKYPYEIIICGDDMYSQVYIIDNDGLGKDARFDGIPIFLKQKVTVLGDGDDHEVNEELEIIFNRFRDYDIGYHTTDKPPQHIIENIVGQNPEYKIGGNRIIYRENVNPTEEIRRFKSERGEIQENEDADEYPDEYPTDWNGIYENWEDYHHNVNNWKGDQELHSYGDGIPVAKDIEDHCRYIYSLFVKAQNELKKGKATGEDGDGTPSNPDDFDDPERIRTINKNDKANEVKELISQKRKLDEEIDRYTNKGGVDEEIDKEERHGKIPIKDPEEGGIR